MLAINPIKLYKFNKKYISFGENQNQNRVQNNKVGLMSLDKNQNTRINFEKDMYEAQKADMVQTNPVKALKYNFVKAYNTLCTPKRQTEKTESTYIHLPYMA
jgi:hypothetical protein